MIKLSRHIAKHIAKEISELIYQHVNVMDHLGYIIASTDEARIGDFHEGAQAVIKEQLELLIIEEDEEYVGAKKGINLPIVVEDEIIGVIGVTGNREQVELYGQIIKKMTEILVVEAHRKEAKEATEKICNHYIEEWLFDKNMVYDQSFISRGEALGIEVTLPRRIVIMKPLLEGTKGNTTEGQFFLNNLEKRVKAWVEKEQEGNLFLRSRSKLIGLIRERPDKGMLDFASSLEEWIEDKYKIRLALGIDKVSGDWRTMNKAYSCAKKAFAAANVDLQNPIKLYEEITVELFTGEISSALKQEFIEKVFNQLPDKEVEEMLELIEQFIECNGSITLASEQLFMHKNTLQYKLNRINEKTGHNPRHLKDLPALYMARVFYKQLHE